MSAKSGMGVKSLTRCREVGTDPAQTRASQRAIVDREGGGTFHPTQGGGCPDTAPAGMATWGSAR